MKPALSLKLGHKLKLTPRLKQAITLLQMSSVDLEAEIRDALESNPFLEEIEAPTPVNAEGNGKSADDNDTAFDPLYQETGASDSEESDNPLAAGSTGLQAAEVLPEHHGVMDTRTATAYDNTALLDNLTGQRSLAEYLREQIRISPISESDALIAHILIENINEYGYLDIQIDEVVTLLDDLIDVEDADIERVLGIVQSMDPPGIGARDLRECLLIQLLERESSDANATAIEIMRNHFELLSKRDHAGLGKALNLSEAKVSEALAIIRCLDPRPATRLDLKPIDYVVPDVVVFQSDGVWQVRLNQDSQSKLAISPSCKTYLSTNGNREDTLYFRERHQEAKWFLQSLKQRNDTILRVATDIVRHQSGFFEHGERAMKPLTLKQIAETLDLHESTISRATSHKYLQSPRGTHELKFFFSSQLATTSGDALSSTAIQARIRSLINDEPDHKPISDQKIADYFKSMGINVARRTVAKYRELMHIPSSSQRKEFR